VRSSDRPTLRVLYAEDAFDQALLVRSFLQSAGNYEVVHVQDGDQAVRRIGDEDWDLLVSDLNLPGADGFDVIGAFRDRFSDRGILATTGYTEPSYREDALRAGADDVLIKPLDKDEFLERLEVLVGDANPAAEAGSGSDAILAVGGLPGDVEMGCGGTLAQAASQGRPVLILPLVAEADEVAAAGRGARSAASILGVDVLVEEAAMATTEGRTGLVQLALRQFEPGTVFLPAMDDSHPARQEAFRLAKAATMDVPRVMGYQTATTGVAFQPDRFEDVKELLVLKMEALTAYQAAGAGRLDLMPRLAQAYARYWGRFRTFGEVEAFETLRDDSPS